MEEGREYNATKSFDRAWHDTVVLQSASEHGVDREDRPERRDAGAKDSGVHLERADDAD